MDHVRIPISEEIMWSKNGSKIEDRFYRLEQVISESIGNGLRVILCFHSLRSHPIFGKGVPNLFTEEEEVDNFKGKWQQISEIFKSYSVQYLAYELLNEPRAPLDEDWNRVLKSTYLFIRDQDTDRTLFFGSNFYQIPERMKTLFLPEDDHNIIKTFHFYYPMLFTHYKASWLINGAYNGPIQYPGRPIPNEYVDDLEEPLGNHLGQNNGPVTKNIIKKILMSLDTAIGKTNHPVHCGEFGCIDETPIASRRKWYDDLVSCLEEQGIPWTNWDWKGNFGILDKATWKPSSIHQSLGLKQPFFGGVTRPHLSLRSKVRRRLGRIARSLGYRNNR